MTGPKDCGKTALVVELISRLSRAGVPVIALKRASAVDDPRATGTDTARFAAAGASAIGLSWPGGSYVADGSTGTLSGHGLSRPGLGLEDLVREVALRYQLSDRSVVLAEGFSDRPYPRIQVRPAAGQPDRPALGPVLATWALPSPTRPRTPLSGTRELVTLIMERRQSLRSWASEARSPRPGAGDITAAVLAGGRARRLGGADKWWLDLGGVPLGQRVLLTLGSLFQRLLVVGRDPTAPIGLEGLDREPTTLGLVPDLLPGAGPLGGLITALRVSGRDIFLFGQDMPFIDPGFTRHLLFQAHLQGDDYDVLLPTWGDGLTEPLHALYSRRCLPHLEEALASGKGGGRLARAVSGLRVVTVPEEYITLFGDPRRLFANINTPEDLVRLRSELLRPAPPAGDAALQHNPEGECGPSCQ